MLFPLFFSHSGEKSAWAATTDMCRHSPREQLDVPVCRRKQLLHIAGQGSIHYQEIGKFPWTFQTKTMAMIKQLTYLFAVSPVLSREGSGRCHCFSRPLPTEKAWSFSLSGVPWSQFVATFFLSSLLLWESERSFELYRQVRPRINRSTAISLPCSIPATELSLRQTRTQR